MKFNFKFQSTFLGSCNYRLVMYYIDIKDAFYFMVICVVVLEILGEMACFIDSK